MFRKSFLCLALLLTSSAALAQAPQCMANYSVDGNFFSGRTFQTSGEFPSVSPADAYRRAYANVVRQGFRINRSEPEMGILAAEQGVSGSDRVVPLNLVFEDNGQGGTRVSITFSPAGGLMVGEAGLKSGFCEILGAIDQ